MIPVSFYCEASSPVYRLKILIVRYTKKIIVINMTLLSEEGKPCDSADVQQVVDKLMNWYASAAVKKDAEAAKNALNGIGTLVISFGDKKIGFLHRYVASCSTDISSPCSPSQPTQGLYGSRGPLAAFPSSCEDLKQYLPDGVISHGEIKLDWVRIGLLSCVALLFIALIYSLISRREKDY